MARKKKQDLAITIAIIGAIGAIIAGYYQGPLADSQWKERPIADISLGSKDLPNTVLQKQNDQYFVPIVLENRGKSDAKTVLVAYGTSTKVRIGEYGDWTYQYTLPFIIKPDPSTKIYPLYVLPDENTNSFTVTLSTQIADQPTPFQEINLFRPTSLTYEKTEDGYILKNQQ